MRLIKKKKPEPPAIPAAARWRAMYEGGGSLKLAAAISAEAARLTTLEFSSKIYGSKRADFLNGAYGYVTSQARHLCELACALGGVMLKPYVADGKIETAFVPADSFEVTRVSGSGNIIGAKFYDSFFADGKKYIKCEEHIPFGNGYIITNRAYCDRAGSVKEIPLSEVERWRTLEREVKIKNAPCPFFAYFRMPYTLPEDLTSPLGAPIYARAAGLIEDAGRQYERLLWEFESGERALYVDEAAVRRTIFGETALPDRRLYRMLNTGNDELFNDWTPQLRDVSIINGLERILQRIEFNSGLAYGTISDPQTVEKTAEEIRASKQRSYATVVQIQNAMRTALEGWARAADALCSLYGIGGSGLYLMDFAFDDSIVADRAAEFDERMQLLREGVITSEEMRNWYLGSSEPPRGR